MSVMRGDVGARREVSHQYDYSLLDILTLMSIRSYSSLEKNIYALNRVLVVTKLIVSGTQCATCMFGGSKLKIR